MSDAPVRRIFLSPGEVVCTAEPALIKTVLGSCVAVTLWDSVWRLGGVNHFILPRARVPEDSARYGSIAMKQLMEEMVALGARVAHLQAKVFGGAGVLPLGGDHGSVGAANVAFALSDLSLHRIPVKGQRTGGEHGRLLVFNTATGEAFVRPVAGKEASPSDL
jgi:chemotaxis protein CheD